MIKSFRTQLGFTLVEMIVALAVFSVVITIAVGALLSLIASNEQLQNEQSVMTNLSFALDSMAREIRTGTNYFCDSRPNYLADHSGGIDNMFDNTDMDSEIGDNVRNCSVGRVSGQIQGVSFIEGGNSVTGSADRIVYFFDETKGKIFRRISGQTAQSITSSGIYIEDMEFYVTGSTPLSATSGFTKDQASVTMYIKARDKEDSTGKFYEIQTTITQRALDI